MWWEIGFRNIEWQTCNILCVDSGFKTKLSIAVLKKLLHGFIKSKKNYQSELKKLIKIGHVDIFRIEWCAMVEIVLLCSLYISVSLVVAMGSVK